jgi:lysylphosphatidylglycerol synthetase-like protein (DUF2156 family)
MYLLKAFAIWLVIVVGESVNGTLRTLLLAPRVGDFRARQVCVFTGALIVFIVALVFARWIAARTSLSLLAVGFLWLALTILFEVTFGRLVSGFSWARIISDYDVGRGGLLGFGMLFILFAPLLAARPRSVSLLLAAH